MSPLDQGPACQEGRYPDGPGDRTLQRRPLVSLRWSLYGRSDAQEPRPDPPRPPAVRPQNHTQTWALGLSSDTPGRRERRFVVKATQPLGGWTCEAAEGDVFIIQHWASVSDSMWTSLFWRRCCVLYFSLKVNNVQHVNTLHVEQNSLRNN